VVASIVVERRAASLGSTFSVSNIVGHLYPSRSRIGWEDGVKATVRSKSPGPRPWTGNQQA